MSELQPNKDRRPVPVSIEDPAALDVRVVETEDPHDYDHPQQVVIDVPSLKAAGYALGKRKPEPSTEPSLAPTTTLEQDLRTQAQRDLNMTWEVTQALISKIVVGTTCIGVMISIIARAVWPERLVAFPAEWWAIVGLVIGFYFGRTNHARTNSAPAPAISSGVNYRPLDDRSEGQ